MHLKKEMVRMRASRYTSILILIATLCACICGKSMPENDSLSRDMFIADDIMLTSEFQRLNLSNANIYDVVVISSEPTALAAALFMANEGKKVAVINQHGFGSSRVCHIGLPWQLRRIYEDNDLIKIRKDTAKYWKLFESWSGKKIVHNTGYLYFGDHRRESFSHLRRLCRKMPHIVRRKRAKKGPEVEVEYVQTFIAVYCSLGCVP